MGNGRVSPKLERSARSGDGKAFLQKLLEGKFLDTFLNPELVIQVVIRDAAGVAINPVQANTISIAIGANQANLKISDGRFTNAAFCSESHCSYR